MTVYYLAQWTYPLSAWCKHTQPILWTTKVQSNQFCASFSLAEILNLGWGAFRIDCPKPRTSVYTESLRCMQLLSVVPQLPHPNSFVLGWRGCTLQGTTMTSWVYFARSYSHYCHLETLAESMQGRLTSRQHCHGSFKKLGPCHSSIEAKMKGETTGKTAPKWVVFSCFSYNLPTKAHLKQLHRWWLRAGHPGSPGNTVWNDTIRHPVRSKSRLFGGIFVALDCCCMMIVPQ